MVKLNLELLTTSGLLMEKEYDAEAESSGLIEFIIFLRFSCCEVRKPGVSYLLISGISPPFWKFTVTLDYLKLPSAWLRSEFLF
jgi:hypothetical protein